MVAVAAKAASAMDAAASAVTGESVAATQASVAREKLRLRLRAAQTAARGYSRARPSEAALALRRRLCPLTLERV